MRISRLANNFSTVVVTISLFRNIKLFSLDMDKVYGIKKINSQDGLIADFLLLVLRKLQKLVKLSDKMDIILISVILQHSQELFKLLIMLLMNLIAIIFQL